MLKEERRTAAVPLQSEDWCFEGSRARRCGERYYQGRPKLLFPWRVAFFAEHCPWNCKPLEDKESGEIKPHMQIGPSPFEVSCVGGHLQCSPISEDAKHPVILPKQHHVSDLIIRHYHLCCGHSGLEHTLSVIRERYWIVQARISLYQVLNGCFHCKRIQASMGQQKTANSPVDRVCPLEPPFTHVGVHCFGPLFVHWGRSTVKRYGVLFTCLAVHAI